MQLDGAALDHWTHADLGSTTVTRPPPHSVQAGLHKNDAGAFPWRLSQYFTASISCVVRTIPRTSSTSIARQATCPFLSHQEPACALTAAVAETPDGLRDLPNVVRIVSPE